MGQVLEFIKDQYRHCKPILALGDAAGLVEQAGVPARLPDGKADPGLLLGGDDNVKKALAAFEAAMKQHRHYAREVDPPAV